MFVVLKIFLQDTFLVVPLKGVLVKIVFKSLNLELGTWNSEIVDRVVSNEVKSQTLSLPLDLRVEKVDFHLNLIGFC